MHLMQWCTVHLHKRQQVEVTHLFLGGAHDIWKQHSGRTGIHPSNYVSFNWTFKDTSHNSIRGSGEFHNTRETRKEKKKKRSRNVWREVGARSRAEVARMGGTLAVWGPDVRKRRRRGRRRYKLIQTAATKCFLVKEFGENCLSRSLPPPTRWYVHRRRR